MEDNSRFSVQCTHSEGNADYFSMKGPFGIELRYRLLRTEEKIGNTHTLKYAHEILNLEEYEAKIKEVAEKYKGVEYEKAIEMYDNMIKSAEVK